jgi:S1-C subfamily serine protease
MEDLTKQQLILLALLVSFVTSIATGIATVSLLDQAPPQVTRVINRVVERTVETVTPSNQAVSGATAVVKEETIVVREDELIAESIAKASHGLVRVLNRGGETQAFGFVLDKDGRILASTENIEESTLYNVVLPGGVSARARVTARYPEYNSAVLSLEDVPEGVTLSPLALGGDEGIKLGGSVIVVSGAVRDQVALGIISRFDEAPAEEGADTGAITGIYTTISNAELRAGVPLLNLFGEVIGVHAGAEGAVFTPIGALESTLRGQ